MLSLLWMECRRNPVKQVQVDQKYSSENFETMQLMKGYTRELVLLLMMILLPKKSNWRWF